MVKILKCILTDAELLDSDYKYEYDFNNEVLKVQAGKKQKDGCEDDDEVLNIPYDFRYIECKDMKKS